MTNLYDILYCFMAFFCIMVAPNDIPKMFNILTSFTALFLFIFILNSFIILIMHFSLLRYQEIQGHSCMNCN